MARSAAFLLSIAIWLPLLAMGTPGCASPAQGLAPSQAAAPAPSAAPTTIATFAPGPRAQSKQPAAPTATAFDATPLRPPYVAPSAAARLVIPAIGVDAPLTPVGVTAEGEVESPAEGGVVGWYNLSPPPGPRGNSVLVGHVDYHGKPAVFWRLRELKPGDLVQYREADGAKTFAVEWVQSFPANAAPIDTIFASTSAGKITLITCEGVFDPRTRNYLHRLVVRAAYKAE
jgi:LPXTG-site transpeptidase (sortase) family protein